MRFWQKYRREEYGFGTQAVIFCVSDSYSELFQNVGSETDIFMLESVKKDLNTEEGSFAIDELPFSINHLACRSEDDERAMYFCLDATNEKAKRYCAVFFGEELTLDNLLFIGKISSTISGTDKKWNGSNFEYFVNPLREYKFTAYSFDISILEEVKLTGRIESFEGASIDNIYQRFENENWTNIKSIFGWKPAYGLDRTYNNLVRFAPLGNLRDVIGLYLSKAEQIINELAGTNIQFNLIEGTVGLQTSPVKYTLTNESSEGLSKAEADNSKRIELRLATGGFGEGWSSIFIHRRMIDPSLGNTQQEDWQKNQVSSERSFSFKNLDNISELLFEIARSFGCYLLISYGANSTINIEFKSRKGLVEDEYTYIEGVIDASIDTSSIISKGGNNYYGLANNYAADGFDEVANKTGTSEAAVSVKFEEGDKMRKNAKEKRGVESERLLLTTSPTMMVMRVMNSYGKYSQISLPLNATTNSGVGGGVPGWDTLALATLAAAPGNSVSSSYERLHTAIYIATTPPEPSQIERLGASYVVWRPSIRVFTKIGDKDFAFDTLTEYVNYIQARDVQYYETEYSLTIPFWNAFSKNTNGSNSSWKYIKLGSKVKMAETVKRYTDTGWVEQQIVREYVVVGIEWNLQKPETKLKLHNLERFAFGYWAGDEGLLPGLVQMPSGINQLELDDNVVQKFVVAANETINAGDAVMIAGDGLIAVSRSSSAYRGKTIGVALESGEGGQKINVQIAGEVELPIYNFTNIGGQVFARTSLSGLNITENILTEPSVLEDLIICLGQINSANSFILDIKEFPFEMVGQN